MRSTNRFSIRLDLNISSAFVGLTAAGYDLAPFCDDDRLAGIPQLIGKETWPPETLAYFGKARTASCPANPYWPRAFLLILASLYLTEQPTVTFRREDVAAHIRRLEMISPSEKESSVIDWVGQLPGFLEEVRSNRSFPVIWELLQDDFERRRTGYEQVLDGSVNLLRIRLGVDPAELPSITVIVNRLGARQADDFASVCGKICAITADPDPTGILHELLHHLIGPKLKDARASIRAHLRLLAPILDRMVALQYAWNDGPESWDRVFEEHMMRAVSLWVAYGEAPAADRQAARFADEGFIYAPALLNELRSKWRGLDDFGLFVSGCLEACESVASV